MFLSLLALSSYLLLLISVARAQVSAPNCTDESLYTWSYNSLDQSPCLVAAYLAAVCNNGAFSIPALLPENSYTGPTGIDDGDQCKCNTVLYNLISACDACQGASWIAYSEWSYNCTTQAKAPAGTFPEPVPDGTRIPKWAFIDTSIGDSWNLSAAEAVGDTPEVTGTASVIPSTVRVSQSTVTPNQSGGLASPTATQHSSSSNAGAIAGGVVGGLIGAAAIGAVIAFFIIRRRRARSAPSTAYMSGQGGSEMGEPVPYPLTSDTPRLYDPSDPTTYPHPPISPTIYTTTQSNQYHSPTSDLQPNRQAYSGLPEV